MSSPFSERPRFCLRCHRKWTANDTGRYIELKRGILCIDCHMKITEKLEQLKTRYATARREILAPMDIETVYTGPAPENAEPRKEPLPEAEA